MDNSDSAIESDISDIRDVARRQISDEGERRRIIRAFYRGESMIEISRRTGVPVKEVSRALKPELKGIVEGRVNKR